jgi:hypothetical protein
MLPSVRAGLSGMAIVQLKMDRLTLDLRSYKITNLAFQKIFTPLPEPVNGL